MCTLKDAAERFMNKHGMMPCVFIDGVNLLASENEKVFLQLVSYAKEFANNRLVHIVMVSSEGSVMPILNKTSAMNRSACLIEVNDIPYSEALMYLRNGGIPDTISTKLVQYFGGRFVYLNSCVVLYKLLTKQGMSEDMIVNEIISLITDRRVAGQRKVIVTTPLANTMLAKVSDGDITESDLLDGATSDDQVLIEQCIKRLISTNVLRYNVKSKLMWHSQIEKSAFKRDTVTLIFRPCITKTIH